MGIILHWKNYKMKFNTNHYILVSSLFVLLVLSDISAQSVSEKMLKKFNASAYNCMLKHQYFLNCNKGNNNPNIGRELDLPKLSETTKPQVFVHLEASFFSLNSLKS